MAAVSSSVLESTRSSSGNAATRTREQRRALPRRRVATRSTTTTTMTKQLMMTNQLATTGASAGPTHPRLPPPCSPAASMAETAVDPLSTSGYRVIVTRMVRGARDAVFDSALVARLNPVVRKIHRGLAQHVDELSDELLHALRWIEYAEAELARYEVEVACLRDELAYAYGSASHTASSRTDMDVDDDDDDDLSSLSDECEDDGVESALKWMKSQSSCVTSQPLDEATARALEETLAGAVEALVEVRDEELTLSDLEEKADRSRGVMEVVQGRPTEFLDDKVAPRSALARETVAAAREPSDSQEVMATPTAKSTSMSTLTETAPAPAPAPDVTKTQGLSPNNSDAIPLVSRIVPPKIFPSYAKNARRLVGALAHAAILAPVRMTGDRRPSTSVNIFGWAHPTVTAKASPTGIEVKAATKAEIEKTAERPSGVALVPAKKKGRAVAVAVTATKTAKKTTTTAKTAVTDTMPAARPATTMAVSPKPTEPTKPTKSTKNKKPSVTKAPSPVSRRWR